MEYNLRCEFKSQVCDIIRVARQLYKDGDLTNKELKIINDHMGALKSILKNDVAIADNGLKRPNMHMRNSVY